MAAEGALEDPPVAGAIEDRAPGLELADPVRRLLGVELGHPRVVDQLPADHRVAKVDLPAVPVVDVTHGGRHATFRHDRVGLAQQRLADEPDRGALRRRFDRRPQARAAGTHDEHVVRESLRSVAHSRMAGSVRMPSDSRWT